LSGCFKAAEYSGVRAVRKGSLTKKNNFETLKNRL